MPLLVRDIFRKLAGRAAAARKPRIFLGAFGKCPPWNDHIDPDIGLEGALGEFKQLMYLDGVRDRGIAAWNKASPVQLMPYGHTLLWRRPECIIAGRLWYSRDGRDRDDFPLVICAQCEGLSLDWVFAEVLPVLADLEFRLKAAQGRDAVISLVDAARQTVASRAMSDAAPPAVESPALSTRRMLQVASCPEMDTGQGLLRVLHVLEGLSRHSAALEEGELLRVPRCASNLPESVANWLSLLDARFKSPPMALFLAPHDVPWMDILVGRPNGAHFVTLRASEKLIPLTTDIAYTLDDEFVRNVSTWVQQARSANV